jgi:hypothetical protein
MLSILCGTLLVGCALDRGGDEETTEIVDNLIEAGYPDSEISIVDGLVYVGLDAHVTLEASREMIADVGSGPEQYRTTNLVDTSTVDKICVVPSSSFAGTAQLSAGLDLAIENYNQQALSFALARGNAPDCDAIINAKVNGPVGGSSGFPSGGRPYGEINIGSGLKRYSVDVNEHVITHELGHTIGFRHTDYYNRSISCGSGGNEGDAGIGAILIPGTSQTATRGGSLMNSCFRSSETGEWLGDDVTALQALY